MILILRFYSACCLDMDMVKLTSKTKGFSFSGILGVLGNEEGGLWRRRRLKLRERERGQQRNATSSAAKDGKTSDSFVCKLLDVECN